jgi:glycerol-3-phosphate dehydrogenase (NAD(P)+)
VRVVVVGGGSWGSVFAALLAERGHDVALACRDAEQARAIADTGRNPRYVPYCDLSGVQAVVQDDVPTDGADLVCLAVPSRAFRAVAASLPGDAPLLGLAKGLDPTSGTRLSQVVGERRVAVLSGPNHA